MDIECRVVHNASIMNAVACTGLQLYSFGETVSIPLWEENWKPDSFFDKILRNLRNGLHTLCLLDIKVKEKSIESIIKGRDVYEKPRFMTTAVAAQQLLQIIEHREKRSDTDPNDRKLFCRTSVVVGLARVGADDQRILTCTLEEMAHEDLGLPLHSLTIPGTMHPLEQQIIHSFGRSKD